MSEISQSPQSSRIFGEDLFGVSLEERVHSVVARKFLMVPLSVLNAREGDWQNRKRAWIDIGIKSEIGRGENMLGFSKFAQIEPHAPKPYDETPAADPLLFKSQSRLNEIMGNGESFKSGTSIFDPVLCELMYTWFCPKGGQIVDPFSGGSVRGVVASILERKYWGCDLSKNQVDANRSQGALLCPTNAPVWVNGDSAEELKNAPDCDFVFSCPPYFDLEVYGEDPRDLSTMTWEGFIDSYRKIIALACAKLKQNRFACFVVGNIRADHGGYNDLCGETINAFRLAGLDYYNEGILVTAVGSLPIRITRQFESGRKFGKTHQNILVFVKGDWKKAAAATQVGIGSSFTTQPASDGPTTEAEVVADDKPEMKLEAKPEKKITGVIDEKWANFGKDIGMYNK